MLFLPRGILPSIDERLRRLRARRHSTAQSDSTIAEEPVKEMVAS
jgi:hypothetical protein